jgi:hypothetical protein
MSLVKNNLNNQQTDSQSKNPKTGITSIYVRKAGKKIGDVHEKEHTSELLMEIIVWLTIVSIMFLRI